MIYSVHATDRPGWIALAVLLPGFDARAFDHFTGGRWIFTRSGGDDWRFLIRNESRETLLEQLHGFLALEALA